MTTAMHCAGMHVLPNNAPLLVHIMLAKWWTNKLKYRFIIFLSNEEGYKLYKDFILS